METIHFETVLEADRLIRLPEGLDVPKGVVEVTVRQTQHDMEPPSPVPDSWLLTFAKEAEQSVAGLPSDMAERHDYYAHGTQP